MAYLINRTGEKGIGRHVTYGEKYRVKDNGIIVIGSNDKSDVILKFAAGGISRQHSFIIGREGEFYVGDFSVNGTYCPYYGFGKNTKLVNVFESRTFKELYGDFNYEREVYRGIDNYVDDGGMKRHIFLNSFVKKPENVDRLIGEGERVLYRLRHGVKIGVFPLFILEFRDNLFNRLFGR